MDVAKIIREFEAREKEHAELMPTEAECLQVMFAGFQRLRVLGWSEAMYCPKDGTVFDSISAGSTGIHPCHYDGKWPNGSYWVHDGGDLWPGHPILWKAQT